MEDLHSSSGIAATCSGIAATCSGIAAAFSAAAALEHKQTVNYVHVRAFCTRVDKHTPGRSGTLSANYLAAQPS